MYTASHYEFAPFVLRDQRLYKKTDGKIEELIIACSTPTRILEYLIVNRTRVVDYEELANYVWPGEQRTDKEAKFNRIYVHISKLKTHLEEGVILNYKNQGYQFMGNVTELGGPTKVRDNLDKNERLRELINDLFAFSPNWERLIETLDFEFTDHYCEASLVKYVAALGDFALERLAHVNEDILTERCQINPRLIKCVKVRIEPKDEESLTGYYILYPITKQCEQLIKSGLLAGSQGLQNDHICTSFAQASALYLSVVYGKDRSTRAFLLYLLRRDITEIVTENQNIKCVYTRPCTADGARAAARNQFQAIPANQQMYCYKLDDS